MLLKWIIHKNIRRHVLYTINVLIIHTCTCIEHMFSTVHIVNALLARYSYIVGVYCTL